MNFHEASKKILPLALPMTLIQLMSTAGGFVCMAMLAHLGHETLAASALIFSTQMSIMVISMSLLFSISILVGHAFGARNYSLIGNLIQQGWTLSLLIGIPIIILFLNMGSILVLLGQSPALSILVQEFFHGYIWAVIPLLLLACQQQLCYGINKQKLVVNISLFGIIILISTAYVLIFGKFGFPRLGVKGLGYAMSLQVWFGLILMTLLFYYDKSFKCFDLFSYRVHKNWSNLWQMLKIGWPISLQMGGELFSFFCTAVLVGWLGTTALAASQIITQYSVLLIIPMFSLSQATGISIGQAYGRNEFQQIKNLGIASMILAFILTCIVAIFLLVIPKTLASIYLDINNKINAETLHLVVILFAIVAISQIFDALRNVLMGALRGLLDTKYPMYCSLSVIWLIGIPLSYILAFIFHMGIVGIYIGSGIGLATGAFIMMHRWKVMTKKYNPISLSA